MLINVLSTRTWATQVCSPRERYLFFSISDLKVMIQKLLKAIYFYFLIIEFLRIYLTFELKLIIQRFISNWQNFIKILLMIMLHIMPNLFFWENTLNNFVFLFITCQSIGFYWTPFINFKKSIHYTICITIRITLAL